MTVYTYLYTDEHKNADDVESAIQSYVDKKRLKVDHIIEENQSTKVGWQKRQIGQLMESNQFKPGDDVVIYEAADIARSTSQVLEILLEATARQIKVHFVKYNEVFRGQSADNLNDMLSIMQHIENDFIARRTTEALARRRAAGLPLGRPKGRKNKNLKLDKSRKEISRYLELGISKASISKLVKCHPQTLYDWIERHEVPDQRPRKARQPRTSIASTSSSGSSASVRKPTVTA